MVDVVVRFCNILAYVIDDIIIPTIRSVWKYFLRRVTGQSELERIIRRSDASIFEKNQKIKKSLKRSRSLKQILDSPLEQVGLVVQIVVKEKFANRVKSMIAAAAANQEKKNGFVYTKRILIFQEILNASLRQIIGYEQLKRSVESIRTEFYDSRNESHEFKLLELWSLLSPDWPLDRRISERWADALGFQGNDPATDFRGMGLLGLDQLLFLAKNRKSRAQKMAQKSKHAAKGYPFAIVGIGVTALIRDLLISDALQRYFVVKHERDGLAPCLDDFHHVYCLVFMCFDYFWYKSDPSSIMDYSKINYEFREIIYAYLNTDQGAASFASLNDLDDGFLTENIRFLMATD